MLILRTVFLSLHVAGGVAGLILGAFALRPPAVEGARRALRRGYLVALSVLVALLVATVAVDWQRLATTQQVIFAVLVGLGLVMLTRITMSFRLAQRRPPGWQAPYMNHVYFTYISLWEGLFIVSLFDLGAPPLLIGAVAAGLLVLGAYLFWRYRERVLAGPGDRASKPVMSSRLVAHC